jgi:CHAD domain-containing protein
LRLALSSLPKPSQAPLTEKTLHSFRIGVKQARYLAELASEAPEAKLLVDELKRVQDAAGDWHDAVKLKEKAEKHFGSASESALVSVLQNISRARFRSASNTLMTALTTLFQRRQPAKPSAHVQHIGAASNTTAPNTAVA